MLAERSEIAGHNGSPPVGSGGSKRQRAGQTFISDDCQSPKIPLPIQIFAEQLFRRHLGRGSHQNSRARFSPRTGRRRIVVRGKKFRNSEVQDFDNFPDRILASRKENGFRFEIQSRTARTG